MLFYYIQSRLQPGPVWTATLRDPRTHRANGSPYIAILAQGIQGPGTQGPGTLGSWDPRVRTLSPSSIDDDGPYNSMTSHGVPWNSGAP